MVQTRPRRFVLMTSMKLANSIEVHYRNVVGPCLLHMWIEVTFQTSWKLVCYIQFKLIFCTSTTALLQVILPLESEVADELLRRLKCNFNPHMQQMRAYNIHTVNFNCIGQLHGRHKDKLSWSGLYHPGLIYANWGLQAKSGKALSKYECWRSSSGWTSSSPTSPWLASTRLNRPSNIPGRARRHLPTAQSAHHR